MRWIPLMRVMHSKVAGTRGEGTPFDVKMTRKPPRKVDHKSDIYHHITPLKLQQKQYCTSFQLYHVSIPILGRVILHITSYLVVLPLKWASAVHPQHDRLLLNLAVMGYGTQYGNEWQDTTVKIHVYTWKINFATCYFLTRTPNNIRTISDQTHFVFFFPRSLSPTFLLKNSGNLCKSNYLHFSGGPDSLVTTNVEDPAVQG